MHQWVSSFFKYICEANDNQCILKNTSIKPNIFLLLFFFTIFSWSQNPVIDSLKKALKATKIDTSKVNTLNVLAGEFIGSHPDSTTFYSNKAVSLAQKTHLIFGMANASMNKGNANIMMSQYKKALVDFNEAQKHYILSPLPLIRPIPALKALVWIRQGQLQKAQAWADENGLAFDDCVSYIKEFEYMTLARLLLAQVRNKYSQEMLKSAKHLLENLRQDAQANHRTGSLIEILILQAVCFDLDGNIATALQYLEEALVLAEPQAYVQVFIDEGKAIQSLLEKLSEQGIMQQYIAQLLSTRHKA